VLVGARELVDVVVRELWWFDDADVDAIFSEHVVGPDPEALHRLVSETSRPRPPRFSEGAATALVAGGPAPWRRDLCQRKNLEGVHHDGRASSTARGRVSVALLTGRRGTKWTITASRSYRVTSSAPRTRLAPSDVTV
jgi:hypothetical protein